jgi:hypothetical protein
MGAVQLIVASTPYPLLHAHAAYQPSVSMQVAADRLLPKTIVNWNVHWSPVSPHALIRVVASLLVLLGPYGVIALPNPRR